MHRLRSKISNDENELIEADFEYVGFGDRKQTSV
jgi:hypothetical protein